eukprot:CAMPEP_0175039746 /NCGR_PEP_ID=MMETSP0052_2-20121109/807_1 /TAXON_ID=51329 ORGANISM="Polytomella parva, Strain SAG 63-3" /NCGR_SAMPLE_ID=MMETSP0052_2 /ASSEMBLY_ACC=CAM_ASM_000194 /LENGTH=307 /DNA_ID=CAMNT_0016301737 /DNA_START=682 /DNA_END=1603 /DNA_ORIENTATION=-
MITRNRLQDTQIQIESLREENGSLTTSLSQSHRLTSDLRSKIQDVLEINRRLQENLDSEKFQIAFDQIKKGYDLIQKRVEGEEERGVGGERGLEREEEEDGEKDEKKKWKMGDIKKGEEGNEDREEKATLRNNNHSSDDNDKTNSDEETLQVEKEAAHPTVIAESVTELATENASNETPETVVKDPIQETESKKSLEVVPLERRTHGEREVLNDEESKIQNPDPIQDSNSVQDLDPDIMDVEEGERLGLRSGTRRVFPSAFEDWNEGGNKGVEGEEKGEGEGEGDGEGEGEGEREGEGEGKGEGKGE